MFLVPSSVPRTMWSGLELRDVRVFLVLADELHFGRTAERVGLTASRVSQTVQVLERQLGGLLFERTSRRVELTALGRHLRDGLTPAYAELERAWSASADLATGIAGRLRVGVYAPIAGGPILIDAVRAFADRHPACEIELIETGFARNQLDWLRRGDVDALVIRLPLHEPDVTIGPVLTDEARALVLANDHPLAGRAAVEYEELADYAVPADDTMPATVMDALIPPRTPSGRLLRRVPTRGMGEVLMRVAAGQVVHPTVASFLEHYPHPDLAIVPIVDLPRSRTALAWLTRTSSAALRAFVDVIEKRSGAMADREDQSVP
jgi:DNA-binding transcriptional LysR family regulator